jgi:peptidoglycan/LPS O-acetylase OafA/YrhL
MKTLGQAIAAGRDNNLNLVRMLAATLVMWGHAGWPKGSEPFASYFDIGTGDVGVDVFFFLSGLLVAKSFLSRGFFEFAFARAKRIYPGLWVSLIVTIGVAGLAFSQVDAGDFWLQPETLRYLLRNALVLPGIGAQTGLPNVFESANAHFNVPLWTLPHEISMYVLLGVVGLLGGLRKPWVPAVIVTMGLCAAGTAVFFGLDLLGLDRARFLVFFFAGVLCFVLRDGIKLSGRIAAALVVVAIGLPWLFDSPEIHQAGLLATMPYIVLWISFVPTWPRTYNRLGDYSYGTYIYSFPVQIALRHVFGVADPIANFMLGFAITLCFAVASWHLIEKRALALSWEKMQNRRRTPIEELM